jgi:hypothetical protein
VVILGYYEEEIFNSSLSVSTIRKPVYWQHSWQGRTRTDLSVPASVNHNAAARAFTVTDNIVVNTAGYYHDGNGTIPCYWTGPMRIDLPIPDRYGHFSINGITASPNGTVYTVGSYGSQPCYWQGSSRRDLYIPAGAKGTVTAITMAGETLYTLGSWSSQPCYWVNSARTDLLVPWGSKDYKARAFTVAADRTVYTAGHYFDYYRGDRAVTGICYWKNSAYNQIGSVEGIIEQMLIVAPPHNASK